MAKYLPPSTGNYSRNFRQNGVEITPEQWTVLLFLWEKDGVTQQELCNATFKRQTQHDPLDRQYGTPAFGGAHRRQKRSTHQFNSFDQNREENWKAKHVS